MNCHDLISEIYYLQSEEDCKRLITPYYLYENVIKFTKSINDYICELNMNKYIFNEWNFEIYKPIGYLDFFYPSPQFPWCIISININLFPVKEKIRVNFIQHGEKNAGVGFFIYVTHKKKKIKKMEPGYDLLTDQNEEIIYELQYCNDFEKTLSDLIDKIKKYYIKTNDTQL